MVEVHFTVRGEVNGKRAEVRLEPGQVRVQVLTVVAQQPAVDVTFPFRDITDLRLVKRVHWSYVVVSVIIAGILAWDLPASIRELGWLAQAITVLFFPAAFGLVAWLLPRYTIHIATQEAFADVEVSVFTRRRATELIGAVYQVRPDLRSSTSGPTSA